MRVARGELTGHRRPLHALTGIRFFAAALVVLYHSRIGRSLGEHGHQAASNFVKNGFMAVPLFFVLSGFILAYTYEGQIATGADHKRFWEARFARIWPAYMISLVCISLPHLDFPSVKQMFAATVMLQSWDPWNIRLAGVWNFVCWTISAEALFYLIFPWVQVWLHGRRKRTLLVALGALLVLCIAANTGGRRLWYDAEGMWRWVPLAVIHVPEFVSGVALGNLFLLRGRAGGGDAGEVHGRIGWLTYGAAALSVVLLCFPEGRWTTLTMLGFVPLVYGLAVERTWLSRFLSTRVLILGGGISYSMYLMQFVVRNWVLEFCDRTSITATWLRTVFTWGMLLVISYAMFKLVENPARMALRKAFAGVRGRSAVSS